MSRIDHILTLSSKEDFTDSVGLVKAYCFCLTPQQACKLLLYTLQSQFHLRDMVLRKVCNDISLVYKAHHETLIKNMLNQFSQVDAKCRQSIAYCLATISRHVPAPTRRTIQEYFIRSKFISIRKRAFKSLSEEIKVPQKLIETAWKQFGDTECGWLIVKTFPVEYLVQNRHSLAAVFSEGWQLSRLYLRIGEATPDLLKELKQLDQISYCYVIAKLGIKLTTSDAKKIVDSNASDERLGLLVWAFGRLGLWGALQYVQTRLLNIQKQNLTDMHERYSI